MQYLDELDIDIDTNNENFVKEKLHANGSGAPLDKEEVK